MGKMNCWEQKACGREPGGRKEKILGVCPAAREVRLHGVHGGRNGGRACWVVAGSLCGGEIQGSFAQKFQDCSQCGFYLSIKSEEGFEFELSAVLLKRVSSLGNRRRTPVVERQKTGEFNAIPSVKSRPRWWGTGKTG